MHLLPLLHNASIAVPHPDMIQILALQQPGQWQDHHVLDAPMQESDGRAFLVRSINNSFVGISQLSDSYTDTTGLVSVAPRVSDCLCNHAKACHGSQLCSLAGKLGWRPRALQVASLP